MKAAVGSARQKAGPSRAGPSQPDPSRAGPSQPDPSRAGLSRPGPSRPAPSRSSPAQSPEGEASTGKVSARTVRFGPLASYIGYWLRRAQVWAATGFLDTMKELDLRPTQFAVLILINENPGIRPTEVCAALGLQKANFVPLVNELQRRGLVSRKAGVPDRRSSALYLTPQGEALLQHANQLHARWEAHIAARLGARGQEQLRQLLRKLT
jgi:DNA-binding MarR family transcriptional regulator